jgi:deazaflavin-dependent oxidoreductase (nitroreductase family)
MTMPADMRAHNRQLIERFRAEGGPPDGRPLLLLTTVGARTGREHTAPMMFVEYDGQLMVVASNAGASRHPDWFTNLVAHPDVTVEQGGQAFRARALVPTGAERDRLWARLLADHPFFADHQAKVSRTIPIVVLERAGA